jgi:hypothetical protein
MCWIIWTVGGALNPAGSAYWEGAQLDAAARAQLVEPDSGAPHLFVAQESLPLSTAPVLEDGRLMPRPVMLRGFVVADGEGYRVMPGGLARVSSGLDTLQVALQKGGISKDWWVLAPTPQRHVSLLRQAMARSSSPATAAICPAGWRIICSGWAATASVWTAPPGCCAKPWADCWNGSRTIPMSVAWTTCWRRWKSRCRRWRNRPAPGFSPCARNY